MEVKFDYNIPNEGKFYLNEIISNTYYNTWFQSKHITILNKSLCGNGGTTGFIDYAKSNFKGLLILVPNVSITKSKELQYIDDPDICCVYGGCNKIDPNSLIVISTYDQFPKLTRMLQDYGMDFKRFWSGRCIVIDEYHKLIDENGFRDICYKVTDLIKHTENSVVLMSATPHWEYVNFLRSYVRDKEVVTYNIKYDTDYEGLSNKRVQVYPVKKDLKNIIRQVSNNERYGERQVCVFYNNVSEIKKILNHLGSDNCEVLCSSSNRNEIGGYYSEEFNPDKRLHFMTSAYFTGHDINIHIDICIIVGSQQFSCTSYSDRELKQMLGRFRAGVSGVFVFVLERKVDRHDYIETKNQYDQINHNLQQLEDKEQDWCDFEFGVRWKQQLLNLQDILDRYPKWGSVDNVMRLFRGLRCDTGEYVVRKCKIRDLIIDKDRKKLPFKVAKQKIMSGETVSYDEYQYNYMLSKYYETYGGEKMMTATFPVIKNWYTMSTMTDGVCIDVLTPDELFNLFEFRNFGVYRSSYLISCVKYVVGTCEYSSLPKTFYDVFGAYLILYKTKDRDDKNEYMIIRIDESVENTQNSNGVFIRKEKSTVTKMGIFDRKISYQTEITDHCYAITVSFDDAKERFNSLTGIPLYDWVNEDKTTRLPLRKKDKDWVRIKNFKQTKISEMYKDSPNKYRYGKSEMDRIDHIIVDIDGGLTFSQFQQNYENCTYTAYPTISNLTSDWTKFRVIFPLEKTLTLTGEYNLQVLKTIRTMVCPYEDRNHQLYSNVNREDFKQSVFNDGEYIDIPQELVDSINISITNNKGFVQKKFNKSDIDLSGSTSVWTVEQGEEHFIQSTQNPEEGARHKALFVIKNRLDDTGRTEFEKWLGSNYGSNYLTKWKSHKVVCGKK